MADSDVTEISTKAIDHLDLSPEVKAVLVNIQAELKAAYQQSFIEMVQAIQRQASALERLQTTLNILIERLAPDIKGQLPMALRGVQPGESPDVATTLVIADPIATGYTLTQTTLAQALGLSTPEVSILARAFKLHEDGDCAVVVRKGKSTNIVNYHPRAIDRFKELVHNPPADLTAEQKATLGRVLKRLQSAQAIAGES
jgi:predicted transcriptional regulator